MVTVTKHYNGMRLIDLVKSTSPVMTEIAVENQKLEVARPLFLQTHRDAYKYSSEVFLNGYSWTAPQWGPRGNDKMPFRYDHYFSTAREAYDFFREEFYQLEAILKGVI